METETENHPKRWLILIVLCLCTLVLVLDNQILTVAIPPLTRDLGASAQDIQWIIDAYILVFAGLLVTAGSLSDRYGRRKVLLIGLVIFGSASLLATYAGSVEQLIAGRVLMGIGGSLVMPSTLSILITVFNEEERRRAISIWSAVLGLGMVGGPTLGGALIGQFWWGVIFLINVPVVVVAVLVTIAVMPESKGHWRKPDPLGAVLSVVGMTALVLAIIEVPKTGISDPLILAALAVAVASLVGFGIWEVRSPSPMVPLGIFRNRNFSGGSLALVMVQLGTSGLMLVLPQYFQFILDYTPTESGMAIAPMAAATILGNAVGGSLGMKIGNRPLTIIGVATLVTGFVVLTTFSPSGGYGPVVTALTLIGLGSGLAFPAAIAALMGAVPEEHAGVGSALNDTVQQTGAAFGVAVLGSVLAGSFTAAMPTTAPEEARHSINDALSVASRTADPGLADTARDAFTTAMSTTFIVGGCCGLVAIVVAFLMIRDRKAADPAKENQGADATH